MGKKDSANYKAAIAAQRTLNRVPKAKDETPAYAKANAAANKTYNKLTKLEKFRFSFDGRTES